MKKIAFVKAKVYAAGLYVGDDALAGRSPSHRGKTADAAFFKDLVWGDFPKEVILHFARDVGQGRIQDAMREAPRGSPEGSARHVRLLLPRGEDRTGMRPPVGERRRPRGHDGGEAKPPIADKNFTAAVFGLYVGEHPLQDDIKADLVSRAAQVLGP